jgi:DNA-binding LacI/PurR family transcriptional regulator
MVVSESPLNAFHPSVAHEVQVGALKHGYTVLTLNNGQNEEIERESVQRFLDHHVDAVIFCAALNPANVRAMPPPAPPSCKSSAKAQKLWGRGDAGRQ